MSPDILTARRIILDRKIADWQAACDEQVGVNHVMTLLNGTPWIVWDGVSLSYSVSRDGDVFPVTLTPTLNGVMSYTRYDAEKVAALRDHATEIVHVKDIRGKVLAALTETRSYLND